LSHLLSLFSDEAMALSRLARQAPGTRTRRGRWRSFHLIKWGRPMTDR